MVAIDSDRSDEEPLVPPGVTNPENNSNPIISSVPLVTNVGIPPNPITISVPGVINPVPQLNPIISSVTGVINPVSSANIFDANMNYSPLFEDSEIDIRRRSDRSESDRVEKSECCH